MKKDITKRFLGKENRYLGKMISKDVCGFISRKKINIDTKQISYDVIDFRNVFSTKFTKLNKNNILYLKIKEFVSKNGKRIEFSMIYCEGNKSHSEFLLSEIEVTQELYELVMEYNPSWFKGKEDSSQRPVENVTWYDAVMFCNKLSELQGKKPYYKIKDIVWHDDGASIQKANVKINKGAKGFRLPYEQEWEYAAKAGTNNRWSGTNDESRLGEYAWFLKNSNNATEVVATKKPNEWGFYDMSGNVFEWCYDKDDNSLKNSRVIRGGSWCYNALDLRSALRSDASHIARNYTLGFRVAASL